MPPHIEQRCDEILAEHDQRFAERRRQMQPMTTRTRGRKAPPKRTLLPMPEGTIELRDGACLEVCEAPPRLNDLARIAASYGIQMSEFRVWESRGLSDTHPHLLVLATYDITPRWGPLLHVSISSSQEYLVYPAWDDILAIRAAFYPPDRDAMMVLPREADYINIHPNTFHLYETPEDWGIQ